MTPSTIFGYPYIGVLSSGMKKTHPPVLLLLLNLIHMDEVTTSTNERLKGRQQRHLVFGRLVALWLSMANPIVNMAGR